MDTYTPMNEAEFLEFFRGITLSLECDLFAAFKEQPETPAERVIRETYLALKPHHQRVLRSAAEVAAALGD